MKIKNQFIICIVVFSIILLVIAASVATTEQQVTKLNAQEVISSNIERSASSLNSISIDYFLYQEDICNFQNGMPRYHHSATICQVYNLIAPSTGTSDNIDKDLNNLNQTFVDVTAYLQNASRTVSVRIDPAFQQRWSNMALKSQALVF